MKPSQLLRQSKTYLEDHGWCQGKFYDCEQPESPACAVGAMMIVSWSLVPTAPPVKVAEGYLQQVLHAWSVWDWNDDPNRTLGEVLAAFDAAIVMAEQDEAVEATALQLAA